MSVIIIIWSMVASACLTLAAVHAMIWFKKRAAWANLLFSVAAVSTAGLAFCELWMMRAKTPEQFGTMMRWCHVPIWAIVVPLIGFVLFHLRAGRPWLAWTVVILRTLALVANFLVGQNLNYLDITGLRSVPFLGESVSTAEGTSNPWMLLGQASQTLLVVFLVDATIAVWRRGERRQALTAGCSIALFMLLASAEIAFTVWGRAGWPIVMSPFFTLVLVAVSFELSHEVIRASQLAGDLLASEERMSMAVEATELGVWSWNIARDTVWGSERWRRLFGFERGEDVGFRKVIQRIHPDDRDTVEREVRNALANGIEYVGEYRVVVPGGAESWIAARGRSYADANNTPVRMMGTALEITKRKQNEGELAQLRLDLAHLARVMTINELSASLAHEINQPLGAIMNNASAAKLLLARLTDAPGDIDEILQEIIQDTKRAGDVVRKIRGMVKKEDVQLEPLQMNDLIEEMLALVSGALNTKGVSLRLDLEPNLAAARGDRVRLQQVLLNLTANALDAMAESSSRVLTIRSTMQGPGIVTVSVSDSGPGIDQTKMNDVFKPFYTTKKHGLGLGLSICRSIIEEHNGRIWAENNPAGGAIFSFSLNASKSESA